MVIRLIIAGIAVAAVALAPRSRWSAFAALTAGAVSVLLVGGSVARDTLVAVGPMLLFLTAALGVAALAERAGLAERAAARLAGAGGPRRLYALICACSALLTCVVSLDGAVVLMVPLVRALSRRTSVPAAPLLAGAVAVANAASLAVPEGNPTNLVVMSRLGLSPAQFVQHLFLPGVAAAVLCALVPMRRLGEEAPVAAERGPFVLPWRIGAQMAGLLAALDGVAPAVSLRGAGLVALLAVAGGTAAAAALANNLPVSASVAALATAGPGAYAALIGLSVGALATAHGSVATMIAHDLARDRRPWARVWAPAAAAAVALATLVLWALS
ncbi:MAG TPA: SLC13 family permease [Solirubrobacteraceae bacterium]